MAYQGEAPFNPAFEYAWRKPVTVNGVDYARGDKVNKADFDERRLAALVETRLIEFLGFGPEAPAYLENGRGLADQLREQLNKAENDAADARAKLIEAQKHIAELTKGEGSEFDGDGISDKRKPAAARSAAKLADGPKPDAAPRKAPAAKAAATGAKPSGRRGAARS